MRLSSASTGRPSQSVRIQGLPLANVRMSLCVRCRADMLMPFSSTAAATTARSSNRLRTTPFRRRSRVTRGTRFRATARRRFSTRRRTSARARAAAAPLRTTPSRSVRLQSRFPTTDFWTDKVHLATGNYSTNLGGSGSGSDSNAPASAERTAPAKQNSSSPRSLSSSIVLPVLAALGAVALGSAVVL